MGEIGADRPVDDEAAQRGAALPGGADGGEHDRPDRHVEIGGRGDDHGVVAAELEDRAAVAGGDLGADDRAHAGRAGGGDDRHVAGLDQRLPDRRAADDDLGEAFGRIGAEALDRAVEDLHRRQRRKRRFLRRLPDHRIAADERERRVPGPDGDREIERRNDRARPKRMPGLRHPVAGAFRGDDEAVQLPREPDGEIADVDHLLHFAQALGDDLADLERHEGAESLLRGAQFLAKQTHELAAAGRGNLAPGEKGVARPVDDRRHGVRRRLPDAGDLGPVDRRADGERAAANLRRGQPRAFEHVFAGHRFASSVDRFADAARESLSSTPIQPARQAQPREEGRPLQDFGQITPRARPISLVHGR